MGQTPIEYNATNSTVYMEEFSLPRLGRFPPELILQETVPGADTAQLLEDITRSKTKLDVNYLNEYGHTVLGTAAFVGSMRCCKILIELGAAVKKKDGDGWTALHFALARGYLDVAKYLIRCGGDVHMRNEDGDSALDFVKDGEIRIQLLKCFEKYSKRKTEL